MSLYNFMIYKLYIILSGCAPNDPNIVAGLLDIDGLPPIGRYIEHEQPYYRYCICLYVSLNMLNNPFPSRI